MTRATPLQRHRRERIRRGIRGTLIETLRGRLEAQQAQLSNFVRSELRDVNDAEERRQVADTGDLAGDAWDDHTTVALLEQEGNGLLQIEWALARIDRGTYGSCDVCGGQIPAERLRALPLATTCVGCQLAVDATNSAGS